MTVATESSSRHDNTPYLNEDTEPPETKPNNGKLVYLPDFLTWGISPNPCVLQPKQTGIVLFKFQLLWWPFCAQQLTSKHQSKPTAQLLLQRGELCSIWDSLTSVGSRLSGVARVGREKRDYSRAYDCQANSMYSEK